MSALPDLLERRRDGILDAEGRLALDRLLDDPDLADAACDQERLRLWIHVRLGASMSAAEVASRARRLAAAGERGGSRVRLPARRRRPRTTWVAAAAAGIAAAVLALAFAVLGGGDADPGWRLTAGALVDGSGGRIGPGGIVVPDAAWTASGDGATLAGDRMVVIQADPGTGLRLTGSARDRGVALTAGRIDLTVPPLPAGDRLRVTTAEAEVAVVGTRFSVASGTTGTAVAVTEGRVTVTSRDGSRILAGGETLRIPPAPPEPAGADARWGPAGLRGLAGPDDGWIADGRPRLRDERGAELATTWEPTPIGGILSGAGWRIAVRAERSAEGVALDLDARWDGPRSAARLVLAELAGPGPEGWPTAALPTRDHLPILTIDGAAGMAGIAAEAADADLTLACAPAGPACRIELASPAAQGPGRWTARVHLAAARTGEPALLAGRRRAWAAERPLVHGWDGIRRIGMVGWSGGPAASPGNPNRWYDPGLDVRTAAGRQRLAGLVAADGEATVAALRRWGADTAIVWGIEGARHLQDAGFIGDPRLLPDLAPEMDALADAWFARLAAAGLRTGILVRPWILDRAADPVRFRFDAAAGERELAGRIAYARRRWGCSVFLVQFAANGWSGTGGMDPRALERIRTAHPGIVLITDIGSYADLAWRTAAAGWESLSEWADGEPYRPWRAVYPDARPVLHLDLEAGDRRSRDALAQAAGLRAVPMLWIPGRTAADLDAWTALVGP